jgi:hypothetical protein
VSQEVKILPSPFPKWMIAVIAFILSTYASSLFIKAALSTKRGRMMIMGKSWIEGYWYLQTSIDERHPHPITNDGITSISYEGSESQLSVFTYRSKTETLATGFSSVSELTIIREYDIRFSNYFTITEGLKESKGISVGKFYRDQNTKHPNRYEGMVVLFSDGINRRQVGYKIPTEIVKFLRQSNGEKWMDALLKRGYEHLLELIRNKG